MNVQEVFSDGDQVVPEDVSSDFIGGDSGSVIDGSVSSSSHDYYLLLVSGGDLEAGIPWSQVSQTETESSVLQDSQTDYSTVLDAINYKLGLIVALLVFFFCFSRFRSAVRGMTGRGID